MSRDPERWRDGEVDADVARLLGAMRAPRAMTSAERARTARRVARIAALPVAAGTVLWLKTVAYAAVIGTTAAVSGYYLSRDPAPSAPPSATPSALAPLVDAPPSPPTKRTPTAPEPSASASADSVAPPPALDVAGPSPSASASADPLKQEAALLERARSKLASDPAGAMAVLAEHAQQFPRGQLTMEREMLMIDALSRAGRQSEAQARARALLSRSPGGLYEKRLKKLLGQD